MLQSPATCARGALLSWSAFFKLFDVLAGVKDFEELKHFQVVPVLDHTTATPAAATKEKLLRYDLGIG